MVKDETKMKTPPKAYYLGKKNGEKERRVAALETIARELGYLLPDGSGNVSGMLQAIADGELVVKPA
jgi:hypothetical protein